MLKSISIFNQDEAKKETLISENNKRSKFDSNSFLFFPFLPNMFSFLFLTKVSAFSVDKPYAPDIKVGCLNRVHDKCKRIVTDSSIVYCHVTARIDGQPLPIINTTASGSPLRIRMGSPNVIPGFLKGLSQACLGETRRITIPPGLAYGEQFVDGLFDPDSTWIADVEILDIVDNGEI